MSEREIVGVRDPFGFRPLVLGQAGWRLHAFRETCAFDLIHAEFIRDVEPGEVRHHRQEWHSAASGRSARRERHFACSSTCISRGPTASSTTSMSPRVRTAMGRELARLHPVEADLVVPVPDSGNYAALGFAEELKHPVRARVCAQPLHRADLSSADAAHPRLQRAGEAQPDQGSGGGQARGGGGRLDRARDDRARARGESARGGREGGAYADQLPAAPARLPLRHRFPGSEEPAGEPIHRHRRSASTWARTASATWTWPAWSARPSSRERASAWRASTGKYPVPVDPELDKYIMERRDSRENCLVAADEHPTLFAGVK